MIVLEVKMWKQSNTFLHLKCYFDGCAWLDEVIRDYLFIINLLFNTKNYVYISIGHNKKIGNFSHFKQRLLKNGTTTACYFGSLHLDGTLELVKSVLKYHQRAFVGKVSMNLQNDAGYYNSTEKELQDAEEFVQKVLDYKVSFEFISYILFIC